MGNLCVICSIAMAAVQVLDWYNPYMDFMGHSKFVLDLLCLSSVLLSLECIYPKRKSLKKV